MTNEAMKKLADRMWHDVWNAGKLDVVDEIIAPDYVGHIPGQPDVVKGPEGFKQMVAMYRAGFPDLHLTVEDIISDDSKVVIRWTSRGTNSVDFMGVPATHKSIEVPGITILAVRDGLIVEEWEGFDTMAMMMQLGLAGQ